jgi:acetyl esterase/lipase
MILGVAGLTAARAQTPEELTRTARYLEAFQNPDGGFAGGVGQASSLGATSSVVRTLGFVGGAIRDVHGAIAFVKSCHDPKTGGFAQRPGGTPDVGSTASGLMAVAALKLDVGPYAEGAIGYLSKNVSGFENIRIAVAGLEAVKATSPDFAKWTAQVVADRNPDGTFGQGAGMPRATGSATVALLRMGFALEPEKKAAVLAALRNTQKPDGGWSRGDGPSDLETSYRIMRLFFMLKEKPDLERLRQYLSKHRASDGGYAPALGQAESPGGTYFCAIMNLWARQLDGEPTLFETAGFVPLTSGKDLTGWEGDSALWSVKDGVVVGESPGIKANNFLATDASYGDFILKFNVRLSGDSGNSGVQFRSVRLPGHEMSGYQADIGPGWWGNLYDESRRNKNLAEASTKAREAIHKGDWNSYVIRAMGGEITFNINGVESIKYVETDDAIPRDGRIALQLHAGGPMKVEFKDLYIQPLPSPKADDSSRPGFHLKTVKTPQGERKYTVYVPQGYDGTRPYPAVLFLHGSGERGDDGIRGGQIGLGAAILAHPDRFPALAVLPQASKTWEVSSDDAKAALAALDAVMADYKVDADRVALTGLSMGGAGAWSIASADPARWSCVVPVCGRGKTEMAKGLKPLPTWVLVGDMDRDDTVRNAREMVQALKDAGGMVKSTEYRSVGHNSWDRAYNDPALIGWMLEQTRKKP